ncbi:MAG TPA: hypothetical protein VMY77_07710 [Chitinophagaceae bacterium]|nr:hypothetical protein [Chitinophagaceae bacterium]
MNRKKFIKNSVGGVAVLVINPFQSIAKGYADIEPYKLETVKEFVIAGHGKLDVVKQMLQEYPNLLYSRYDWGNGDFEEAIEGAGHVGNKEIAQYLIEKGARANIYVLTMLGETSIVKAILERYPSLLNGKGPHGLSLLHHAKAGGESSKELYSYFEEKGLKEMKFNIK